MSVAWRLRLVKFSPVLPGFFVSIGARRTDFDLFQEAPNGKRSFVFDSEPDATAAGVAAFTAYARHEDVLLPLRGAPGVMLAWKDINQRARALQAKTPDEWRAWLRTFSTWETSGDPMNPVRAIWQVLVEKDSDGAWKVKGKQKAAW